jgi:hypothetical protein
MRHLFPFRHQPSSIQGPCSGFAAPGFVHHQPGPEAKGIYFHIYPDFFTPIPGIPVFSF